MKKALVALFLLLPLAAFGQTVSVWDGSGDTLADDIDSQWDTSTYTGRWEAMGIWDDFWPYLKYFVYELWEDTGVIYTISLPDPPTFEPSTWDPVVITQGDIGRPLTPGKTYRLQVTAMAQDQLEPETQYVVATGQSDGVLILGGEEPPPDEEAAGAGRLSLSVTPSSLTFSAGEEARSLQLRLSASGAGSIQVTSIREDRTYPLWGQERGFSESLSLSVPGGLSETINRMVTLNTLERAKALGAGTEGSFTLTYVVSGRDTWGNSVSATVNVPVAVSGAPASTLSVQGVSVQLPSSPYFRGEAVVGSTITVQATGSGTVLGQVYVDDSLSWTEQPAFAISISGTTAFAIEARLPTDEPGVHTVRVQLISPPGISGQSTYEVSAADPPFPPQTLILIPGVAELSELAGTALAENLAGGGTQYTFRGTAALRLLSLDGQLVPGAEVNDLVVRYEAGAPGVPVIAGGTIEKEGAGQTIAAVADGCLRIGKIAYDWAADPGRLSARTVLHLPLLDSDVVTLDALAIAPEGVELGSWSWDKADPKSFSAFGVVFRLHDVGADKALILAKDAGGDRYAFSMSGSVAWREKDGVEVQDKEIVGFSGLTFYSDGDFEGAINVSEAFDLIPGILTITQAGLEMEDQGLSFSMGGQIENLPYPMDVLESTFTLAFDTAGNLQSRIVPIDELSTGARGLGQEDSSEWSFGFATLDVTYLGVDLVIHQGILNRDHSRVLIGADIYLNLFNEDGSDPGAAGRRIGFGEIGGESGLTGGLEVAFDGEVTWPSLEGRIDILSGKSLDLGAVKVSLDNLALEYGSGTFAFLFSGSFRLQVEAVQGGISFVNLRISLDGDISGPTIQGTDLSVMDFVSVRVDSVSWGSGAISYQEDQTSGEGVNRQPAIGDQPVTIQVDSYFEICGAAINIGSDGSSVFSGEFKQLLFYSVEGEHSFVLREARVQVSGCELFADIKYDRTYLRIAGGVTMQQIEAAAVGKIGIIPPTAADGTPEPRAGEPTFGLFVLVGGLGIPVAPSVFLDRVGGGVFINPTDEDITTVLLVAGFNRPELDEEIAAMRPGGGGDPGGFAVMLLGGVYVAERTLVEGEALITLTANYFSLDAKVTALEGMLRGRSYFLISWSPLYAEGNNVLEADLFDLFTINGDLAFYAYRSDAWGVMGGVRVAMLGSSLAEGSFFIGPPGFMVETTVKAGVDIGLVSGSIEFSGMIWYYRPPDPDTWGAWAKVELKGSVLWGLVSGKASIEGALIGQGTRAFVYAVGSASFKVCWVEVWSGSLWVSIGPYPKGFDGDTGRNSRYEALLDEARNMADQVNAAKAELESALREAELALYECDAAQREAAGLALVERAGFLGLIAEASFHAFEAVHWPPELPLGLEVIRQSLFGPQALELARTRSELEELRNGINQELAALETLQAQVSQRIAAFEDLLVEPLPALADLASGGNPFLGLERQTVQVGEVSRQVVSGFHVDEAEASRQREAFQSVRDGFAGYQDAFIEQAAVIDGKLAQLDVLLFEDPYSLSRLTAAYAGVYARTNEYLDRFLSLQADVREYAEDSLQRMDESVVHARTETVFGVPRPVVSTGEEAVRQIMREKLQAISPLERNAWNTDRLSLIGALFALATVQGAEVEPYTPADDPNLLFEQSGVEVWWQFPRSGFEAARELALWRPVYALYSHRDSTRELRDTWAAATSVSDVVFERQQNLYEILHEIYDQLAVYGSGMIGVDASGNAVAADQLRLAGLSFRQHVLAEAISQTAVSLAQDETRGSLALSPAGAPVGTLDTGTTVKDYFAAKRSDIAPYLEVPTLVEATGEARSDHEYAAALSMSYAAEHPVGMAEYAYRLESAATGAAPQGWPDGWISLGMRTQLAELLHPLILPQGDYFLHLRARGAGGMAISRRLSFTMGLYNAGTDTPFVSTLAGHDVSPPTVPVVSLAAEHTAEAEQLYASWGAADPESGIQRYEYAVGTYSAPAVGAGAEDPQAEGGYYLPGFGSALELAGQIPGVIGEAGLDPAGASPESVPTDVLAWTNAGGRTEAIIKNLDLQHGHRYVVSVRVTNGVGLQSTGSSQPILVDLTPPEGLEITELVQETVDGYPNSLRFRFTPGEDPETAVAAHSFALGSVEAADDLFPWTEAVWDFGKLVNLPVGTGVPIYLSVRGVNVLGLEALLSASLELDFADNTPPPAPLVVTDPQQSSADGSQLAIGWNEVQDPESGIVGYAYGISSTPLADPAGEPDILSWVTVDRSEEPYYIGKRVADGVLPLNASLPAGQAGTEAAAATSTGWVQAGEPQLLPGFLGTDYEIRREDLNLSGPVYAVVRVTNGAGLSTVAASPPLVIDATPPQFAVVEAQPRQSRPGSLQLTLSAGDPESGIQAYRYQIYRVQEGPALPWALSRWIAAGAPATGDISRLILITEFPPPGLQYGTSYEVRFWVRNRAGLTRAANPVTIELVKTSAVEEAVLELERRELPPQRRSP